MHPSPQGRRDVPADEDERLIAAARAACANAYSPYSGVRVGAALLTDDGRVFSGCNVENASYGLTICAERCAAAKAVSEGVRRFVAIAIASNRSGPLAPCGACRQFLLELGPKMRVICVGGEYGRSVAGLDELLPHAFEGADLLDPAELEAPREEEAP